MSSSVALNSEPLYDISSWVNVVAVILMVLNSFIGIIFNCSIIRRFILNKQQKTSFNLICVFRAVNNILILTVCMLFIYVPATILGHSIYPPMIETILLTSILNLMVFNEFQSVYLALNRLIAVYFPIKYNTFFGFKLTLVLHILYYLERVYNVTTENIQRYEISNYMLFNTKYLAYGGLMVPSDGMFYWAISLAVFPFFVNAFTFGRFYYLKKKTSQNSQRWIKAKENFVQFIQTVIQDSLFSISIIFNLKLNTLFDHRFWAFFSQTFVWQSNHVLDGIIMILFSKRTTQIKKKLFGKVSPAPQEMTAKPPTSTEMPPVTN